MHATAKDIWLPVPGFEGHYEVSNTGKVRSLDRIAPNGRFYPGITRKTFPVPTGHHYLQLSKDGKSYSRPVHRLVLLAFEGEPPEGMEACHNNGDPADNRLSNLRWDTPSSNQMDMVKHGRHHYAKRTHCKNGHEYTPENTRPIPGRGGRLCITCRRNYARQGRNRAKA